MMHPYCKYYDGTEVVFSDLRKNEEGEDTIWVSFERPMEYGVDTIIFELPSYRIIRMLSYYSAYILIINKFAFCIKNQGKNK